MQNQNTGFNLEVTKIRHGFADKLQETEKIIGDFENQAIVQGASGQLELSAVRKSLRNEIGKLKNGKFRFLIIGDFNRGKSTILNAFFEKSLLPMGVTATTAIPTFVKYGEQEKVVVYKKNGEQESLSLEEYKKKYTLNSKEVKSLIKKLYNNVKRKWLEPLDYAELYCPIEVLSRGIEFIDTAGLNHTEEENQKTFSYIEKCDAILFVLAADEQFTQKEEGYLKTFLGYKKEIEDIENQPQLTQSQSSDPESRNTKEVRPIFYLINKWEKIEEDEKKEVHEIFVDKFCECLDISEDEAEKMWGDTIFDVYAKTALENLEQGKSLDGTGIIEFKKRLSDFLTNERLMTELKQAVNKAGIASRQVVSKVEERLFTLEDDVKTLEEKIEKTKPCVNLINKIVQNVKEKIKDKRYLCIAKVEGEYKSYFNQLVLNFERDFEMPVVSGMENNQREKYTQSLENKLTKYRQKKLKNWHKISTGIVYEIINDLNNSFNKEINDYNKQRDAIREILNKKKFKVKDQTSLSMDQSSSSEKSSLTPAEANVTGRMLLGGTGGTVGTAAVGAGGVSLAHVFGSHIALTHIVGSAVALTPLGWVLIGSSAVVGGIVAWWQRDEEVKQFQKNMQNRVKEAFKKLLEEDKVEALKQQAREVFNPYEESAKQMKDDIESLEISLDNLLEKKRTTSVNIEEEKERLQTFVDNINDKLKTIEAKYNEIALAQSKDS